MIQAKELHKWYGRYHALKGISFEVKAGEFIGLLGPNGSGKTTTLRILATSLYPSAGTASIAGKNVYTDPNAIRREIGYLPEIPPLYDDMIVEKFLRFAAKLRDISDSEITDRVAKTISLCGLERVAGRVIGHLSKGYKQRVGLAQAIIHNPGVLLLDEPASSLDPLQTIELRNLLHRLNQEGTTIFISSHILHEVTQICKRVLILHEGRLVADEAVGEKREADMERVFVNAIKRQSGE